MSERTYIERYWRDAKPEDAIKDPPMAARFRDSIDCNSAISIWSQPMHLVGWDRTDNMNWCNGQCWWKFCQVYDAPDPGDGWRLIDIEKDDCNQDGIEYWNSGEKAWLPRNRHNDKTTFLDGCLYRIRIAPSVTYVPFTWDDREQLRGRTIVVTWENGAMQEFIAQHFTKTTDGRFEVAKVDADRLIKVGKFLDTGKPVGKEVTQ